MDSIFRFIKKHIIEVILIIIIIILSVVLIIKFSEKVNAKEVVSEQIA